MLLLRRALFAWVGRGPLTEAVMGLIMNRLAVVSARMQGLAARFAAGRFFPRGKRVVIVGDVGPDEAAPVVTRVLPGRFWPVGFGWLLLVKQHEAAWFTRAIEVILQEPEIAALLAASMEARRLLRPMCRMLGVDPKLLRPGVAAAPAREKRVRAKRVPVDWGRIPLPRGALAWAKRERRLERARAILKKDG